MPNVTESEMLAAMNSGLESAGSQTQTTPEENTNESDDTTDVESIGAGAASDQASAGEGGDGAVEAGTDGESPAGHDADASAEAEGEGAGDGRERDPATGKFVAKKKDAEADPKGDAALGPDGKPIAKAPAKEPVAKDPVNDPIPQGLKKETHERMQSLITTAKSLTAERDQIRAQHQEVMGYIAETRATAEQYGMALDYLRMVNSGDPAQIEKCIGFMQNELVSLCKLVGKPVPGVDLLGEHADLQQEVAAGTITRQRAEEIAAARANVQVRTDQARAAGDRERAAAQAQQVRQQGIQALNDLEAELKANDPQYDAKRKGILTVLGTKDPSTGKSLIEATPPSQWTALFLRHYAVAKVPKAAPAASRGTVPANQPLRARNPAGAPAAAPKSLLEAMNMGIDQAGR